MQYYNIKLFRKLLEYEMKKLDDYTYVRNVCLNNINANEGGTNTSIDEILHAIKVYKKFYKPFKNSAFDGPITQALKLYDELINQQRPMIDEEMSDNHNYNIVEFKGDNSDG